MPGNPPNGKQDLHASHSRWLERPIAQSVGWHRSGKAILRPAPLRAAVAPVCRCVEIFGAKLANWLRVQGHICFIVRRRKLTSCSRGKPALFITSHTVGKCLRRDENEDTHSGCGRGLYANVDQSPLSGRGHVTPVDHWGPFDVEPT